MSPEARAALAPAVERDGHDWSLIEGWLAEGSAKVWRVNEAYALTVANTDNEIEVVLAGGRDAKGSIPAFEAAWRAFPAHRGMTLRAHGRKGWKRLLPHWNCTDMDNGTVVLTSGID